MIDSAHKNLNSDEELFFGNRQLLELSGLGLKQSLLQKAWS